jgi:hypothetical protein
VAITQPSASPPAAPYYDDDDDDHEEEEEDDDDRTRRIAYHSANRYYARAGATPVATPTPSPSSSSSSGGSTTTTSTTTTEYDKDGDVPTSDVDDERYGFNLELTKKVGRHTVVLQGAYSEESDYISRGISLRDSIDFNQKNTVLTIGASYANDEIDAPTMLEADTKDSVDVMIGLFQVLNKKTTLTINATAGTTDGYLTDPYKIVQLNGVLVPERRPETKDKQIFFMALNRYIERVNAGAELSYRYYNDSFGIRAHTIGAAWYQKIGSTFIIRPAIRYYMQSEADFYDVLFEGDHEFYSSDYRVSELDTLGYGLKFIWYPLPNVSVDLAVDRYVQGGRDGITADDVYPEALSVMTGLRIWL